jgi:hypothetical protein
MSGLPISFGGVAIWARIYDVDKDVTEDFGILDSKTSKFTKRPFLQSVRIKEGIKGVGEITITLAPHSYEQALELLHDSKIKIGNTLSVKWGYSQHPAHISPWYHGFMVKPDINFGDDMTITINAKTMGYMMSRIQNNVMWSGPGSKKKYSKKQVVEELAKAHNLVINLNHGRPLPEKCKKAWETLDKSESIIQGMLNDYVFIKLLASKSGMKMWISNGNVLNLVPAADIKGKPAATFRYRGQIDTRNNIYPIISISSQTTALFLPVRSVKAKEYNASMDRAKKGMSVSYDIDPTTSDAVSLREGTVKPQGKTPNKVVTTKDGRKITVTTKPTNKGDSASSFIPTASRERGLKELCQNTLDLNAEKTGEPLSLTTLAVPGIGPDDLIKVEGVGEWYSGLWKIWDQEIVVDEGGAVVTYDLRAKGFHKGLLVTMLEGSSKNTQQPKPKTTPASNTKTARDGTK